MMEDPHSNEIILMLVGHYGIQVILSVRYRIKPTFD